MRASDLPHEDKFEKFIQENKLFCRKNKLLVGLSGGVDSMVLTHLLQRRGYQIALAHCNFNLRGEESQKDRAFVEDYAAATGLVLHVAEFQTAEYVAAHKVSIQEAARTLRYEFFNKLLRQFGYDYICVAHHKDDLVETMLINILRITSLHGLKGFLAQNGAIVRPLLCLSSAEINTLAGYYNLKYRHDSSNDSTKYLRNRLRHYVLPALSKASPNFLQAFQDTSQHVHDQDLLFKELLEEKRRALIHRLAPGITAINLPKLLVQKHYKTLLYEILKPYGLNHSLLEDICRSMASHEVKRFILKTHVLIKDQGLLLLCPKEHVFRQSELDFKRLIHAEELFLTPDLRKSIQTNQNALHAYLDAERITFPLTLRYWQHGDAMRPLGCVYRKKISQILMDRKLDYIARECTMVVVDQSGAILWLLGLYISDEYKITDRSTKIMKLVYSP